MLVPGGMLGLIWNVRDLSVGWVAALTRIMEPYEGVAPRYTMASGAAPSRRLDLASYASERFRTRTSARPIR